MNRRLKVTRVVKALQVLILGCKIEIERKRLELMIRMQKTFSSDSIVRKSNELSKLGIKWMTLNADTQSDAIREW